MKIKPYVIQKHNGSNVTGPLELLQLYITNENTTKVIS